MRPIEGSVRTLARELRRRLPVLLAGVVATGAMGAYVVGHEGVYWSRVDAVFVAPADPNYPNALASGAAGPIITAGLVEKVFNEDRPPLAKTTSMETTIVGRGIYDGVMVRAYDTGGQWAYHFNRPVLDVQVAGPSEEVVRERLEATLAELGEIAEQLQGSLGASESSRVTIEPLSPAPTVHLDDGDRVRALAMTVALGVGATTAAQALLDRARDRRRRGRARASAGEETRPAVQLRRAQVGPQ